jgi:hypothetical protein
MPTEMMKRSRQYIKDVGSKIQSRLARTPVTKIEASTKAMLDSKAYAKAAGKNAAKEAGKALINVIGKIDLASDIMMVVQVFCDAFFHGVFPDEKSTHHARDDTWHRVQVDSGAD